MIEAYTPTTEERTFVETMTRSPQQQLNLVLWLKLFPCLGYFPDVDEIPSAIVRESGYVSDVLRKWTATQGCDRLEQSPKHEMKRKKKMEMLYS